MELGFIIVLMLVIILIILVLKKGFVIVSQGETMVIERLGKYHKTLGSGINIIWPFLDKPREILWRTSAQVHGDNKLTPTRPIKRIDLREQVYDYPKQNVITKDTSTLKSMLSSTSRSRTQ